MSKSDDVTGQTLQSEVRAKPPIEIIEEGVTSSFTPPPTKPAKRTREVTRLVLAVTFGLAYVTLIFIMLITFLYRNEGFSIDDIKELATILLVPLGALVATVLGFYFASQED